MEEILKYLITWILGSEVKARQEAVLTNLMRLAARILPPGDRAEYLTKWRADLNDIGGGIVTKCAFVAGIFRANIAIRFYELIRAPVKQRLLVYLSITAIYHTKIREERINTDVTLSG